MPRQIGRKYGPNNEYGNMTILDPLLEGEFELRSFPGPKFRIHPSCDGLICHDGEVVVQIFVEPKWLDFSRAQQEEVLRYLKR